VSAGSAAAEQHEPSLGLRIAGGTGWNLTGRGASKGMALLANVAATRLLVPADVGALLLTNALVLVFATVAAWGMDSAGIRLLAGSTAVGERARARASVRLTLAGAVVGSGVAAAVFGAGGWRWMSIHAFHSSQMAGLQSTATLLLVATAIQQTISGWFKGLHRMRAVAVLDELAVNALWCLALIVLWAAHRHPSVETIVLLRVLGFGLVLVWMAALFRKPYDTLAGTGGTRPRFLELLDLGSALMFTTLATVVIGTTSDMAILGLYRSRAEVAAYGLAASLAAVGAMPYIAAAVPLRPILAGIRTEADRARLERPLRAIVAATTIPPLLLALGFGAAGSPLLRIAFGGSYAHAADVLAVLAAAQVVCAVTGPGGLALQMMGRHRVAVALTAAAGAASVGGDFFAAPRWGALGVAIVTGSVFVVQNVGTALVARRLTGINTFARFSAADLASGTRELSSALRRRRATRELVGSA
jgi:O-antigen/teichoic acid export membrane protein